MKSTLAFVFLIGLLAYAQSFTLKTPTAYSILTGCRPCLYVLKECEVGVKSQIAKCINSIPDSICRNCGDFIADLPNDQDQSEENPEKIFYCVNEDKIQNLACKLNCRSLNTVPYYRDGACDSYTGRCICSKRE